MNQANYLTLVKKFVFTICILATGIIFSQTTFPFGKRYENTINGELTMIGNNILSNHVSNPYNGTAQNGSFDMVYVDVDNDNSTFNSSGAKYTPNDPSCDRIVYAGLYWGATSAPTTTTAPNGDTSLREQIKFKIPGSNYVDITADDTSYPNDLTDPAVTLAIRNQNEKLDRMYYKDVTSLLSSRAVSTLDDDFFYVANVNVTEGFGISAGWTLVIVYENSKEPRRFISTFDGFSRVTTSPVNFNYSGFTTPPNGPVEGKMGVVAMEGDFGITGDSFSVKADANPSFTTISDAENLAGNFFASEITDSGAIVTDRVPASNNTLGWDQKIIDLTPLNSGNTLIGNNETGLTARVGTTGDYIYTFLNTLSINVIEPTLDVVTSVQNLSNQNVTLGSPVQLGETVWYNLDFQNVGTDDAENTVITNTLPLNVTLDESSIDLPTGATYTTSTNVDGLTVLTFNIPDNLVFRESNPANASHRIRYQVTASSECFDYSDACTNVLINSLESSYDGRTSGTNISGQPGLNGINGCGIGNTGAMELFVDTSSCQFDTELEFCNNNLTITGDNGYNIYQWVDQDGVELHANSKTITVSGPGVYTCTQTKVGCTVTTRIVTVKGLQVDFTPFDNSCKDSDNGGVNITVTDDAADFTYTLSKEGAQINTTGAIASKTHTFNNLSIGTYSVRVTNTDGCYDTFNFTVKEPKQLKASNIVTDNIMPCNGNALVGRIEVTGSDGTKFTGTVDGNLYEYSMDGGAFQTSNIFETNVQGDHTMTVKDANGCTITTIANVGFDDEIAYEITKEDVVCLNGSNGVITANVTQNNSGNTLTYSINGGTFQTSPTFSNLTVGDYEITIRKEKGINTCEIKETVSIVQLVDLAFTAESSFVCTPVGGVNTITATVADEYKDNARYRLNGGSENTTGVFENVPAGVNTITVSATVQELGKTFTCAAEPIEITIDPYTPVTITDIENSDPDDENRYRIAYTDGEGTLTYALQFISKEEVIDLSNVTIEDEWFQDENQFDIRRTGYYAALVRDGRGCDRFLIKFLEFKDIQIPNFFTPNRDGTNDTWYPTYIDKYPNISVQIFDRHQRMLSEHFGINDSWNGEYKGKLLPSGDYWYIIRLNDTDDNRVFKGHFTLYR